MYYDDKTLNVTKNDEGNNNFVLRLIISITRIKIADSLEEQ